MGWPPHLNSTTPPAYPWEGAPSRDFSQAPNACQPESPVSTGDFRGGERPCGSGYVSRSVDCFLSPAGPLTICSRRRPNPDGREHRMPVPRSVAGVFILRVSLTMPAVGLSQEESIQPGIRSGCRSEKPRAHGIVRSRKPHRDQRDPMPAWHGRLSGHDHAAFINSFDFEGPFSLTSHIGW